MEEIKALLVGVSDYSELGQVNLPFCKNDIEALENALIEGLKVKKNNVTKLGTLKKVKKQEFLDTLNMFVASVDQDDIFIFYFSGHGANLRKDHYLVFSDDILKTQDIIYVLDRLLVKSKIILLDSCMSGNFEVAETATMDSTMSIDDFCGRGYAVIASSSAEQSSYSHMNKPISLFTSFLCEALVDKYLIKNGKKSLYDIQRLLFLYLDIWNKNHPKRKQNPVYRADIGGTILFPVEEYFPYEMNQIYLETSKYIIYSVLPEHTGSAKRYSVQVILKEPFSFGEIAVINHEIIDKIKNIEVYENPKSEIRWTGQNANIIFCYFGRDESDMVNANYICHTTWVDDTQNKSRWYSLSNNCEMIEDIHFNIHNYYSTLKSFNQENTGAKELLVKQTKKIINELIALAEKTIALYNELLNGTMSEKELIIAMKPIIPLMTRGYFAMGDLDIPPKEIKEWYQSCSNLAATIHDFTLLYNEQYVSSRTSENRRSCMNITIKRYYEDLEKLKLEENKYGESTDES